MLKIERIKPDRNRWTAELTFTPIAFDPDHWFNRSEGFLIDSPEAPWVSSTRWCGRRMGTWRSLRLSAGGSGAVGT